MPMQTRSTKRKVTKQEATQCSEQSAAPVTTVSRKRKMNAVDLNSQAPKRRQFQGQWMPLADSQNENILFSKMIPESPEYEDRSPMISKNSSTAVLSQSKFQSLLNSQIRAPTHNPLPNLRWGEASDVWQVMKKKDQFYVRDCHLLRRHPHLHPRMRSILLDWIMEVCEVYRLHRETFHLAVDYIDRYLATLINVEKSQLQLIGVTALFIAAKLEEIYPPKINDFAYVTDGACSDFDIGQQELIMLKALKWDLTPMTSNMWMCIYLQILNNNRSCKDGEATLTQTLFSGHSFVQIARLMDLCSLDVDSLQFSYGLLAASVLYHFSNEESTFQASGFTWDELSACVSWMAPYAITIRDGGVVHMKTFENIAFSDCHNIQTHTVDLDMLEKAQKRQRELEMPVYHSSPEHKAVPSTLLTPPSSSRKPRILRH